MQVRTAGHHDLEAITAIYNQAVETTTATFDTDPQTVESRRRWFEQHDGRHPVVVAEVGFADREHPVDTPRSGAPVVIGWGALTPWSERKAYEGTVEISIYVDERYRGQGVGTQLCEHLIETARSLDFHTVVSRVASENDASRRLHVRFDFELIGTMREVGHKFGRFLDVDLYQLMLPA